MVLASVPPIDSSTARKLLGRRSLARVPMDLTLRLHLANLPGPLPARARDLGVGGLCISTPTCFPLNDLIRVSLLHPKERFDVPIEGRWQTEVPGRDAYLSGVRFHEVDARTLDRLWDSVHAQTKHLSRWLSRQSELSSVALSDLVELLQSMRLRDLGSGESLFRQGSRQLGEDSIFVVVSGRIVLETSSPRGRKTLLGSAGSGQVIAGSAVLYGAPSTESAIVSEAASLLEISRSSLSFVQATCPALAADLIAIATRTYLERQRAALNQAVDR
jgi:CRP-like cAMP-binding protein